MPSIVSHCTRTTNFLNFIKLLYTHNGRQHHDFYRSNPHTATGRARLTNPLIVLLAIYSTSSHPIFPQQIKYTSASPCHFFFASHSHPSVACNTSPSPPTLIPPPPFRYFPVEFVTAMRTFHHHFVSSWKRGLDALDIPSRSARRKDLIVGFEAAPGSKQCMPHTTISPVLHI